MASPLGTHDGSHGDGCFGCRIKSVQFDPRATPSRRNNLPGARSMNSWEKGILRDADGNPRRVDGRCVGVKEYADNRSRFDRIFREQHNGHNAREHVTVNT